MNKLTTNDLTVQQQNAYLAVMYSLIATNDIVYNLTVDFINSIPKELMKKEMKYRTNLMKADAKKWQHGLTSNLRRIGLLLVTDKQR